MSEASDAVGDLALRELAWAIVVGFVATLMTVGIVVWALLRAGRLPAPMALVVALALLSTISLVGFVFTSKESMLTVAATGVGALAGAVSAQFNSHSNDDDDSPGKDEQE